MPAFAATEGPVGVVGVAVVLGDVVAVGEPLGDAVAEGLVVAVGLGSLDGVVVVAWGTRWRSGWATRTRSRMPWGRHPWSGRRRRWSPVR